MWGRYEIFPILFTTITLITVYKLRHYAYHPIPVLVLGVATSYRPWFVLYLPFLLLYSIKNRCDLLVKTLLYLLPVIITHLVVITLGGGKAIDEYINIALMARVGEGFISINVFIVTLTLLIFSAWRDRTKKSLVYTRLIAYISFTTLAYFGLTIFHPQYTAWLTPITTVLVNRKVNFLLPYFLSFVPFILLVDAYYGCYTSVCLFTEAINPAFANSYLMFKEQFLETLTVPNLINLTHTIFVVLILHTAYLVKTILYDSK